MIRIVGDVCLSDAYFDVGFGIGSDIMSGFNPFKNINRDSSDYWIGNLECVVSDVTANYGGAKIPFRLEEDAFASLKHMNLYAVANNHIMQHGDEAYNRTLSSVVAVGSGFVGSIEHRMIHFEHQGRKVAVISFSLRAESFNNPPLYWADPSLQELKDVLSKKDKDEYLIAFIHWGYEYMKYPTKEQRFFAHWLVDTGVDLVAGGHSHTLQGYEDYNGGRIYYSLGNFVFRMPMLLTSIGAIVNIDFSNPLILSQSYVRIDDKGSPHIVEENDIPETFRFNFLNKLIYHEQDMETYFLKVQESISDFRRVNRKWIIKNIHRHSLGELFSVLFGFIKRRLK